MRTPPPIPKTLAPQSHPRDPLGLYGINRKIEKKGENIEMPKSK
jgi:hypothetical protein